MSRRWNESVLVEVSLDTVRATRRRGWLRPTVAAVAQRATTARASAAAEAQGAASAAVAETLARAVREALAELGVETRRPAAGVELRVGAPLVRFDVASGAFLGASDRALGGIAQACIAELLGDAAAEHETRWQLQPGGRQLLLAALPLALRRALAEAVAASGLRIASLQPDFCVQWNRFAGEMKHRQGVFALRSGEDVQLAQVSAGAIAMLSVGPWRDAAQAGATPSPTVRRLISGLGLTGSLPPSLLDLRADRLLASVGCDAAAEQDFVLVAAPDADLAVGPRWQVRSPLEAAA